MITDKSMKVLSVAGWVSFGAALSLLIALLIIGCEKKNQLIQPSDPPETAQFQFEATGEDFLISALDEIHAIADWSNFSRGGSSAIPTGLSERSDPKSTIGMSSAFQNPALRVESRKRDIPPVLGRGRNSSSGLPSKDNKMILAKTSTDTVYIYGEVTPDGYGAVVTERYAHPKGLLLITVRKSYGKGNGHAVTQAKRYISYADLLSDNPQQTNVTELFGLAADTIVTHVLRNGTLETYTFRLPVITRVVNPQDGSIRVTTRYGANGYVISEVRDGNGGLIQLRRSNGQADGSLVTRTEFVDSSWRQVRTLGQADGTVLREVTSSPPSSSSIQGAAADCDCLCGNCSENIRDCKTCGCAQSNQ
jgi:hypothetical protein